MTFDDLEREYSPSSAARTYPASVDAYASRSAAILENAPGHLLLYGDGLEEVVWLAADALGRKPVHLFIHGGYWQELSWRDAVFPAPDFAAAGYLYGAINYGLAPAVRLADIVDQCRRAVAAVAKASLAAGGDGRVSLSGSSAGAHLAALAAMTDWPAYGLSHNPISAAVLVSGVYRLAPLIETSINAALGLNRPSADRLSPLLLPAGCFCPALICWGEHETWAFKEQSAAFAAFWRRGGNRAEVFEVAGRDHFDVVFDLADPATRLGRAVLGVLESGQTQ